MEQLPIEVVGKILSHVSAARDVILASATCRKWRQAFQEHLRVLSFKSSDWHGFHHLSTSQVEILMTRTIFQTEKLQSLVIVVNDLHEFSVSAVMSWLLYTKKSLKELHYDVLTVPALNVVDICGREKLEKLTLVHDKIEGVDSNYHKFTSLRSLTLSYVHISDLDLSALLAACPKLESFELIILCVAAGPLQKLEVRAPHLRRFHLEGIGFEKLILESDSIEHLHLGDCMFGSFKVLGNGSLKNITIDNVAVPDLEICVSCDSLEAFSITNFMIPPNFCQLISKSSKLSILKLWDVAFREWSEPIDLGTIAMRCPQICLLSVGCDLEDDELLPYCFRGTNRFENMVYLKLGWSNFVKDEFLDLVESLLERCPNIKKLFIHEMISGSKDHEDCQVLSRFTTSILRIMKKCAHFDVQVDFDE